MTDSDISEIFSENGLSRLEEVRIGSSEIGFLRLSEDSAWRFVRGCAGLRAIGGVCDWAVRDLLSLLRGLLDKGGWRISLE